MDIAALKAAAERARDTPIDKAWRGAVDDFRSLANPTSILSMIARLEALEAALGGIKWKSADRDNMEFSARVTCYQLDEIRAALEPVQS